MKTILVLYANSIIAVGATLGAGSSKDASALALLRGVELSRAKYDNLRVELVMEYADRAQECALPCLVEQAGRRRRFEQFAGGCLKQGEVIIVNDREVWGYRRKEYRDLEIYDMERSVGVRGDKAYDPRILGLTDIAVTADATLRELLWIETCDRVELKGREDMKGHPTWRVRATWNDTTSDFWIEEPSFRVHKRLNQCPGIRVESISEFDPKDRTFPFPKHVEVTREEGKKWKRLNITVKSFEFDKLIPNERFTMKSIGLPMNTMINDYRIHRIVGYWDGEGVSKHPVYPDEKPRQPIPPRPRHPHRLLLTGLNAFVILALVIVLVWRWRRRAASAK